MTYSFEDFLSVELNQLLDIAKDAGFGILSIYNAGAEMMELTLKEDQSPLTVADKIAHDIIFKRLAVLTPHIPVISEEGKDVPYDTRKNWDYFWCVDPLDGTKEFIKHNGEFTVNIALIHMGIPVLGVIYVPVTGDLYYGGANIGSWKETKDGQKTQLYADKNAMNWMAVGSRSHSSEEETNILSQYPVTETISAGSSIKFCLIAEGKAHIYYRHGPTMEWDTAAGQAIVTFSGGFLTKPDGSPFLYNKISLLNSGFLCKVR